MMKFIVASAAALFAVPIVLLFVSASAHQFYTRCMVCCVYQKVQRMGKVTINGARLEVDLVNGTMNIFQE